MEEVSNGEGFHVDLYAFDKDDPRDCLVSQEVKLDEDSGRWLITLVYSCLNAPEGWGSE